MFEVKINNKTTQHTTPHEAVTTFLTQTNTDVKNYRSVFTAVASLGSGKSLCDDVTGATITNLY